MKKLRFHVPVSKGKTKCHKIHIGKKCEFCPDLKIHGYRMEKVHSDTYLGDILSSDGKNKLNIKDRVGKGVGKMTEIINTLETVSFGVKYFKIFNLCKRNTNKCGYLVWAGSK